MTVYVTGDIHGGLDMQKLRNWKLGDSLTSDDYLIVAGDFGFPWNFSAEECADIAWLESRPYTVLFVDGNPAGVKAMLSMMGMIENRLRLPLVPTRITTYEQMRRILDELKIKC